MTALAAALTLAACGSSAAHPAATSSTGSQGGSAPTTVASASPSSATNPDADKQAAKLTALAADCPNGCQMVNRTNPDDPSTHTLPGQPRPTLPAYSAADLDTVTHICRLFGATSNSLASVTTSTNAVGPGVTCTFLDNATSGTGLQQVEVTERVGRGGGDNTLPDGRCSPTPPAPESVPTVRDYTGCATTPGDPPASVFEAYFTSGGGEGNRPPGVYEVSMIADGLSVTISWLPSVSYADAQAKVSQVIRGSQIWRLPGAMADVNARAAGGITVIQP